MTMLLQRVANWLANEVIVKSLARSELFQQLAVKTHHHVQRASQEGSKVFEEVKGHEATKRAQEKLINHVGTARTFSSSFLKNLKTEFTKLEQEGRKIQK